MEGVRIVWVTCGLICETEVTYKSETFHGRKRVGLSPSSPMSPIKIWPRDMPYFKTKAAWSLPSLTPCEGILITSHFNCYSIDKNFHHIKVLLPKQIFESSHVLVLRNFNNANKMRLFYLIYTTFKVVNIEQLFSIFFLNRYLKTFCSSHALPVLWKCVDI